MHGNYNADIVANQALRQSFVKSYTSNTCKIASYIGATEGSGAYEMVLYQDEENWF